MTGGGGGLTSCTTTSPPPFATFLGECLQLLRWGNIRIIIPTPECASYFKFLPSAFCQGDVTLPPHTALRRTAETVLRNQILAQMFLETRCSHRRLALPCLIAIWTHARSREGEGEKNSSSQMAIRPQDWLRLSRWFCIA